MKDATCGHRKSFTLAPMGITKWSQCGEARSKELFSNFYDDRAHGKETDAVGFTELMDRGRLRIP